MAPRARSLRVLVARRDGELAPAQQVRSRGWLAVALLGDAAVVRVLLWQGNLHHQDVVVLQCGMGPERAAQAVKEHRDA